MKRLLLTLAVAAFAAGPAIAGQPVTLRPNASDADGVITLGDLFTGAGEASNVPVAARNGRAAILNARAVQLAAARSGLDWANAEGLTTIVVSAAGSGGPAGAGAAPAAAAARGNVEVLTYARNLSAGEIVQPQDLVWGKAAAAPADAPADADQVIGMAARRPLRAGAAVAARDVSAPQVIKAGEMITVVYENEGISLALQAKAMAAAGVGETLTVQNTASKKILQAVAVGPGQAIVGPAADQLKASPTRYALR
ncbi:MAG: flagellar basal body P-ring formation chaperone FlgA [Phenylobacterium sp.]|uniref:flagellar basal body P-ring formation chaperone FlgA n=1 Tax=Phenylobacterium sp. TaxID=1871053 RepID=UPI003919617B